MNTRYVEDTETVADSSQASTLVGYNTEIDYRSIGTLNDIYWEELAAGTFE